MKRSFINQKIDEIQAIIEAFQIKLPSFAYFTAADWLKQDISLWQEVFDLQLGWDLTDFGSGHFEQRGLSLFTLRNGSLTNTKYPKAYAEKLLFIDIDQETPYHFHRSKMEDILNRGGGELCMQLYNATNDFMLDETNVVTVSVDGCEQHLSPGEILRLQPGQGVCFPQYLYHRFWAEKAPVVGWEVSMVNNDHTDNHFLNPLARFADIEEDEPAKWLLCNEYSSLIR